MRGYTHPGGSPRLVSRVFRASSSPPGEWGPRGGFSVAPAHRHPPAGGNPRVEPGNPTVPPHHPPRGPGWQRLYEVIASARVLWLVFSTGYAWYRGPLRGWAGKSHRLDIVARVYAAACHPSCEPREGCVFAASLSGPAVVVLRASTRVCGEREAGQQLLEALRGERGLVIPGLDGASLAALAVGAGFRPLVLREECRRAWVPSLEKRIVILGADIDPPPGLEALGGDCVSIGPLSYLASAVAGLLNALESIDP